jgi:hypothetical protein
MRIVLFLCAVLTMTGCGQGDNAQPQASPGNPVQESSPKAGQQEPPQAAQPPPPQAAEPEKPVPPKGTLYHFTGALGGTDSGTVEGTFRIDPEAASVGTFNLGGLLLPVLDSSFTISPHYADLPTVTAGLVLQRRALPGHTIRHIEQGISDGAGHAEKLFLHGLAGNEFALPFLQLQFAQGGERQFLASTGVLQSAWCVHLLPFIASCCPAPEENAILGADASA